MARNRLTWQNVVAPDYSTAVQGQAQAHRMFQDAIGGLSSSIGSYAQQQEAARQQLMRQEQAAAEAAVLRNLAGAVGNPEAQADVLRSLSGNTQVGNDFLKNIAATRNSILSGDTAATNLDQTRLTNKRTNRDNEYIDQFRPIAGSASAYVAKGGSDPFSAMSPEQIAAFNMLPAEEQTRLTDAWSREGSQAHNRSERSLNQMARELALEAQASGLDGPDHAAYIYQNSPNASVAAKALEYLSTAPSLLDPRGGNIPSRGTGGGTAGGGSTGSASGGLDDAVGRSLQLLQGGVGTRIAQEDDIYSVDGFVAAEKDNRSEAELISELVGPEGVFPGGDRGEALKTFQQVRAENPSLTRGQIAYLIKHSVRPDVPWYRKTLNDIFVDPALSGGGIRVDPAALRAQAAMTGSGAYMQQREAAREREAVERALETLGEDRNTALENVERAERLSRITGGNFDPSQYVDQVGIIDDVIRQTIEGLRGDTRFGELIRDPDNPSQTITQGELRQRRLREAEARIPESRRTEMKSQELQAVVQRLQAEFRELLQNPGQGKPGDLARIQAELRKAQDEFNKHVIKTR